MTTNDRNLSNLFSNHEREVIEVVNYVFVNGLICFFGIVANILNSLVFYKQGFRNTMNISFFGLALSDLCSLITSFWCGTCVNPLFVNSDVAILPREIQYLTGGAPHTCFVRITGWITVYITAERCLCILFPLKIKQLITSKGTMITIIAIYVLMIATFIPEYATSYFDWKFDAARNKTLLGLMFTRDKSRVAGLTVLLYGLSGFASFIAVIAFTIVLVIQLKRKSSWRLTANLDKSRSEVMSNRDRKTINMVAMIATILIVCYIPGVCVSMVTFLVAGFNIVGRYVNAFFVFWSFVFVFEGLNSSVNIFIYYRMSTKYRDTFRQIFSGINCHRPAVSSSGV